MARNQYQDVNALLRSLSAYMPSAAPTIQTPNTQHESYISQHTQGPLYPTEATLPQQTGSSNGHAHLSASSHPFGHAHAPNTGIVNRNAAETKYGQNQTLDSRDITQWPVALRYVTRLIAKHEEEIGRAVRKMINNQYENEKQWWAGREALILKQKDRVDGKRQLDKVLLAIGGQVSTQPLDEKLNERELALYDVKVHKAVTAMNNVMATELANLGIPFFGTKSHLVVAERENSEPRDASENSQITREELNVLKLRMINYLEDMFKG